MKKNRLKIINKCRLAEKEFMTQHTMNI